MRFLLLFFVLLVSACSPYLDSDEAEISSARNFLFNLTEGEEEEIIRHARSPLDAETVNQISTILGWIGTETPQFDYLFTVRTNVNLPGEGNAAARTLVFEAEVEDLSMNAADPDFAGRAEWLYGEVTFLADDSSYEVVAWAMNPADRRLSTVNDFSLSDKPVLNYIFFALALSCAIFCLITAIFLLRGPKFRLRWLWVLGSLVGFGQISLNWTTNALSVQPLFIQVLSAGYLKSGPFNPVIIQLGIPIIAIAYWIHKRKTIRIEKTELAETFSV